MEFKNIVKQWLLLMVGIFIASSLVSGIEYDANWVIFIVVPLLSFLNVVIRPLLILLALPFVIFTLGIGVLFINGLLFLFVDFIVPGFHVNGFASAFWGALIVSFTSFIANLVFKTEVESVHPPFPHSKSQRSKPSDDDVIDI